MLQTTSRDSDPQMHKHVIVANLSRGRDDGLWQTLDSPRLYDNPSAGYHLVRSQVPDGSWLLGSVWNGGRRTSGDLGSWLEYPPSPPTPTTRRCPFPGFEEGVVRLRTKGPGPRFLGGGVGKGTLRWDLVAGSRERHRGQSPNNGLEGRNDGMLT